MRRRIGTGLTLFGLTLVLALLSLSLAENRSHDVTFVGWKSFRQASNFINKNYVETPDPNLLFVSAVDGVGQVLSKLDIPCATAEWIESASPVENFRELESVFSETLKKARSLVHDATVESVSMGELIRGGLTRMVQGLARASEDAYSYYLPPKAAKDLADSLHNDSFGGVGVIIEYHSDIEKILVLSVIPDTPAYRAGLKVGDLIIRVDHIPLIDIPITSPETAKNKIRGKIGTQIVLTVEREGVPQPLDFTVTRDKIDVKSTVKLELEDSIGYIRVANFTTESAGEVKKYLEYFDSAGTEALILDLRYNPGGLLETAVDISADFLQEGKLITYTQGRPGLEGDARYKEFRVERGDQVWTQPMAVLVNKHSASASEIVTGALKDHGRAIVVGTKTFGKGSVQEIFPLADQSSLRLTVAHYFTPNGICIHKIGIDPDIPVELPPLEQLEEGREEAADEVIKETTTDTPSIDIDRRSYSERQREALLKDPQVMAAIEALKKQLAQPEADPEHLSSVLVH